MNHSKTVILSFLLAVVLVSLLGCSSFSIKMPAKAPAPTTVAPTSQIEWKERKWDEYGENKGGTVYFYEKDSISFPAKGIIHLWRKRQLSGSAKGLKEIISFDEIDCRAYKFRSLELQGVNPNDTKTEISKKPSMWVPVFQDSADEYFTKKYCRDALKEEGQPKK